MTAQVMSTTIAWSPSSKFSVTCMCCIIHGNIFDIYTVTIIYETKKNLCVFYAHIVLSR